MKVPFENASKAIRMHHLMYSPPLPVTMMVELRGLVERHKAWSDSVRISADALYIDDKREHEEKEKEKEIQLRIAQAREQVCVVALLASGYGLCEC